MILLKSLIVLLLLVIIAHFIKKGWGDKKNKNFDDGMEGFSNLEVDEINSSYDVNIANDLEKERGPHMQNIMKQPAFFGGEMAAPIGIGQLTPSQRVQEQAMAEQREEEEKTVGQHKEVADNALNMQYLKDQMDELVKLGNEAKVIDENFKNIAKS